MLFELIIFSSVYCYQTKPIPFITFVFLVVSIGII